MEVEPRQARRDIQPVGGVQELALRLDQRAGVEGYLRPVARHELFQGFGVLVGQLARLSQRRGRIVMQAVPQLYELAPIVQSACDSSIVGGVTPVGDGVIQPHKHHAPAPVRRRIIAPQPIKHGQGVDGGAPVVQLQHDCVDALVFLESEDSLGTENPRHFGHVAARKQGSQHGGFVIYTDWHLSGYPCCTCTSRRGELLTQRPAALSLSQ